jgi:hypothetical protein
MEQEPSVNKAVELNMILTAQIIRVLHEAAVDKDEALSALSAASSHVQCMNRTDTV